MGNDWSLTSSLSKLLSPECYFLPDATADQMPFYFQNSSCFAFLFLSSLLTPNSHLLPRNHNRFSSDLLPQRSHCCNSAVLKAWGLDGAHAFQFFRGFCLIWHLRVPHTLLSDSQTGQLTLTQSLTPPCLCLCLSRSFLALYLWQSCPSFKTQFTYH